MSGRAARALCAAAAVAAAGCERENLVLSLGLDAEDKKAQSWLGYYPSAFEPVGTCPNEAAFTAEPVAPEALDEALGRLEKTFAVELSAPDATQLTGKPAPKPDPAAQKAMEAEASIRRAEQVMAAQEAMLSQGVEDKKMAATLAAARRAVASASGLVAPGQLAFLVRGVSFSPSRPPAVQVCYGEVVLSDQVMGSAVPKMWRQPMVVWVATPVRRGRVMVGVTK